MFNEAVITTKGLALDAKIRTGEAVAEFTNVKLGDGIYAEDEDLNEATDLKNIKQSIGISSIKRTNETTVRLRIVVDNEGINTGYYISEIGVYANDPDEGEILYSIATGITGKMDYQPSEAELAGATSTIDIFTSVSNAECAIIATGMGAAASAEDLAELELRTNKIEQPVFDDSGEVVGIAGFPDFLEKVKNKMNLFGFFRDFAAGMKFVLYAGQIVNNCMSDAENLPLAAKQGKVLMDLYTQLNGNIMIHPNTVITYNVQVDGFMTTGNTDIVFSFPIGKILSSDITKCTIESGMAMVRQNGKYILGSGDERIDLTKALTVIRANLSFGTINVTTPGPRRRRR
ncbi:MAG: hypothetical protein HFG70_07540 [Hungatella sp.]|nr:hypothetical protein [Hungatella sp.]